MLLEATELFNVPEVVKLFEVKEEVTLINRRLEELLCTVIVPLELEV